MRTSALVGATFAVMLMIGSSPSARELVLAIGGEPDEGFDPTLGWGDYGHPLFQSTLLRLDPDLAVVGDLATDWSLDESGLVWELTLRDDASFADGEPVTAEDVVFTFETAMAAAGLVDLTMVERVEARDPHHVRIILKRPWITFTRQLTTLGIVPAHAYGPDYGKAPFGSGPFRFVGWQPGQQLVVAPNPYWYGGKIPFERLTFLFTEADTSFAAAMTGDANVVAVPPALARRQVPGMRMEAFRTVDNRGVMFPMVPDDGRTTEAGHPIGDDVTADLGIRRAINLALDREALVALALDGFGATAHGPVDNLPWDNPDAAVASPDMAAATAALDEAGWVWGDDGLRRKDGLEARFRLVYPATDSTRQALALGVADQLRPLGIEVVPMGRSWDEIRKLAHSNAVLFGWGAHDPLEIYNLYHSSRSGSGFFNAGFYANPTVDAHFEAAQAAPSLEASLPHWQAAQWDGETGFATKGDATWAWLVNLDHVYFVDECLDLGRPQVHPHGHGFPITHAIETWRWTCAE